MKIIEKHPRFYTTPDKVIHYKPLAPGHGFKDISLHRWLQDMSDRWDNESGDLLGMAAPVASQRDIKDMFVIEDNKVVVKTLVVIQLGNGWTLSSDSRDCLEGKVIDSGCVV
jgi:hypothetical protein